MIETLGIIRDIVIPVLSGASGVWGGMRVLKYRLDQAEVKGSVRDGRIDSLKDGQVLLMSKVECDKTQLRCQAELQRDIGRVEALVKETKEDMRIESRLASRERRETWEALLKMSSPETRDRIIRDRHNRENDTES